MSNFRTKFWLTEGALALGLFALALWLRTANLTHFVTADEHNWVYRSGLFFNALLRRDWPATELWLTPGVTTTWLGTLGLAGYYRLHAPEIGQPLADWLVSFSRNRVDVQVLAALRLAMALFTAAMGVAVYALARKLWPRRLALLGVLLLLTGPHLLAVSRIIGHDAPATLLMTASLLALLVARQSWAAGSGPMARAGWFLLSGGLAGLGVLSKAPAMALIPFAGLLALAGIWQRRERLAGWLAGLALWLAACWLAFVGGWPAAWVAPLAETWAVVNNAFLSSAGLEDADLQPFWSIPDLGAAYYLVNGLYKISPIVLLGVLAALFFGVKTLRRRESPLRTALHSELFWLLFFAVGFGAFMSLGVKKSPRYILPAFPALAFVAAWGWLKLAGPHKPRREWATVTGLAAANLALSLLYAPYYFSYYNPLLGGGWTAPRMVRVGWGEGLDELGRRLSAQPGAEAAVLGARYKVGLYPFFAGALASPVDDGLDFVAFYIKQSQSGYPSPEILRYFEQQGALETVTLNGVEYAQAYRGPAMIPVPDAGHGLPLAYRPLSLYAPTGGTLVVDLLWPAATDVSVSGPVTLALVAEDGAAALDSTAEIAEIAPGVKVSRHTFDLPPGTPRSTLKLQMAGQTVGMVKARRTELPPDFSPLDFTAQGLKLRGFRVQQTGDALEVQLAWQAWPQANTDYTVTVQLLDAGDRRVAGVDVAPQPGFTALDRKEIALTGYRISLPDNLPPGAYRLLVGLYYFAGNELVNVGSVTLDEPVDIQ